MFPRYRDCPGPGSVPGFPACPRRAFCAASTRPHPRVFPLAIVEPASVCYRGVSMSRRAVVFGAAGQLGTELVRELQCRRFTVMAWDRSQVDITDPAAVQNALANYDAEVVFNAVAYNQVDVAEKEPQAAFLVNALAVRNLALACRQADAQLVHFSTDYVFDGSARHPYVEEDPTHPLGAYAVSKLAGELYAQAYLDRALVVRTSGVFGPGGLTTARGNFVELMLRLAPSPTPPPAVQDHVASPTLPPPPHAPGPAPPPPPPPAGGPPPPPRFPAPPPHLRSRRPQSRPPRHQRARIPYPRSPSQVLRPLQCQNGAHRLGPHAATPPSPRHLLRRTPGDSNSEKGLP